MSPSVPEASAFQDASRATIEIAGTPPTAGESRVVSFSAVTPGYFEMLGVRPLRGRTLEPTDRLGAPPVALVNQAFARRYWPDVDPVGRRFTVLQKRVFDAHSPDVGGRTFEVVGILPNVQVQPEEAPAPFFWTSYLQDATRLVVFHARGHGDAEDLVPILREEVAATADDVLLVPPRTYEGLMAFLYLPQRIASQLLGFAGGFALLLAVMGIYGMVSFAVSERRHEMAIRQAIGAHRGTIFGTVVWGGLRLAATGIVLGMLFAVPSALLMRSGLHGVGPLDPAALSGSALVLLLSAAAATLVPARRATGVDPMTVLREE